MGRLPTPLATLAGLIACVTSAAAHGCQTGLQVGDNYHQGCDTAQLTKVNNDFGRQVDTVAPTFDYTSAAISCSTFGGAPAKPANSSLPVNAGDNVKVFYSEWTDAAAARHWGPVVSYLASCKGKCSDYDASTPNSWMKIYESAWLNDSQQWAAEYVGFSDNSTFSFTLPSQLPIGEYLSRPEIISHQFTFPNGPGGTGAQNFPQCWQLSVTNNGSAQCMPSSPLISIPGDKSYTNEALSYLIWDTPGGFTNGKLRTNITDYAVPGGPLATFPCGPPLKPGGNGQGAPPAPVGGANDTAAPLGKTGIGKSTVKDPTPIIAGVVGGVGGLFVLGLCIWFCCYRRRTAEEQTAAEQQAEAIVAGRSEKSSMFDSDGASYASTPSKKSLLGAPGYSPSTYEASRAAWPSGIPPKSATLASYGATPPGYSPSLSTPSKASFSPTAGAPSYFAGSAHSYGGPGRAYASSDAGSAAAATFAAPPLSRSASATQTWAKSSRPSHSRSASDIGRVQRLDDDFYEPSRGGVSRGGWGAPGAPSEYSRADQARGSHGRNRSDSGTERSGMGDSKAGHTRSAQSADASRYGQSRAGFSQRDGETARYYR